MDRMVEIDKEKKSLAVSVACMAIYCPTPGFKGRTFKLRVLTRWDFNFCVRSSPLRGVLMEEVEEAVHGLKAGKSPGVDNIPSELLKNGGEATTVLTICQKILETKQWPKAWTQSLVILLPKKGNLRQYQNYRTISLITIVLSV